MDIEYLLLLQNFREGTDNVLTPLMMRISEFIIGIIPLLVVAMVYWVFSRKAGAWILLNVSGSYWLNGILKLTACVYRPWIRDPRVVPAEAAIASATGYSFPSGHAAFATAYYGCGALCCWKQKKTRAVSVVMVLLLTATMFSRNYLGVHTPQDVLVGFLASALFMLASIWLFRWMEAGCAGIGRGTLPDGAFHGIHYGETLSHGRCEWHASGRPGKDEARHHQRHYRHGGLADWLVPGAAAHPV